MVGGLEAIVSKSNRKSKSGENTSVSRLDCRYEDCLAATLSLNSVFDSSSSRRSRCGGYVCMHL